MRNELKHVGPINNNVSWATTIYGDWQKEKQILEIYKTQVSWVTYRIHLHFHLVSGSSCHHDILQALKLKLPQDC